MNTDKTKLLKYLTSHRMMQIATCGKSPWICSVYYTINKDCTIYFISEPTTRHCKNIETNNHVAVAISDTTQMVTAKKIGVQIEGVASLVKDRKKLRTVIDLWNKTNPGFEKFINLENIDRNGIKGRFYKIKPTRIKFFNEALYGPEGFKIFTL